MLDTIAQRKRVVQLPDVEVDLLAQAARKQPGSQRGKLGRRCPRRVSLGTGVYPRRGRGPAERVPKTRKLEETGCLHDLKILLVLSRGPGGNLIEPFAGMNLV